MSSNERLSILSIFDFIAAMLRFSVTTYITDRQLLERVRETFAGYVDGEETFSKIEAAADRTPGPPGLKYAFSVGYAAYGVPGALIAAVAWILPLAAIGTAFCFVYPFIMKNVRTAAQGAFNGMLAAATGVIAAQIGGIYKKNKVKRGYNALFVGFMIVAYFIIFDMTKYTVLLYMFAPVFMAGAAVISVIAGFTKYYAEKYKARLEARYPHRVKYDKYSKKAVRERERKIMEEYEEERRK